MLIFTYTHQHQPPKMKTTALLLLCFVFTANFCSGQNLVPNCPFEDTAGCPDGLGYIDYAEGWYNKGLLLNETARSLDSKICFEKALKQNPKFHKARWAKLFSSIPVIAIDNESLQQLRTEFNDGLEELTKWFQSENLDEAYEVIGSSQPFYLAYQDFNNKQLLQKYGQLCCLMMNKLQKFCNFQQNIKRENGKIKLGIIGEQIRDHSVWNAITKGIVLILMLVNLRFIFFI